MFKGKIILHRALAATIVILCSVTSLRGQWVDALGSYSPYSMFGVGKIASDGSAYNYSMGGIGIGMRDNGVINLANPSLNYGT